MRAARLLFAPHAFHGHVAICHLVLPSDNKYARRRFMLREESEVDDMFKELTGELLDLSVTPRRYRKAYLAQTRRPILCCSSCCTVVVE